MRRLIIAFCLVVIAVGTLPWLSGWLIKREEAQLIAALNTSHVMHAELLSYHQGWLQSTATIRLSSTDKSAKPVTFLSQTITHGPFLYDSTKQQWIAALAHIHNHLHADKARLAEPALLEATSLLTWNRTWQNTLISQPFVIQLSPDNHLQWNGINGRFTMKMNDTAFHVINGHFTIGALTARSGTPVNAQVVIQPFSFDYAGRKQAGNWVDAIKSITPLQMQLTANHLNSKGMMDLYHFLQHTDPMLLISGDVRSQLLILLNNLFLTNATSSASNLQLNGTMTPPTTITLQEWPKAIAGQSDIKIEARIAIDLANAIIENYLTTATKKAVPIAALSAPPEDQARMAAFNQKMAALMQSGKVPLTSAIDIMDLRNKHPSQADFNKQLATFGLPADVVSQIAQFYGETQIKTPDNMSPPPADMAKNAINEWIQKGYLVPQNNDYLVLITYDKGTIRINDKAIPQEASLPVVMK